MYEIFIITIEYSLQLNYYLENELHFLKYMKILIIVKGITR